jgi:NAD(P)-dependent dehydrogenase (short-subunit alcohol dehydrogenase family)
MSNANQNGRLLGKVILLTGTGSGMGQGIALAYAREGAILYGCDISVEKNAETMKMLAAEGLSMHETAPVDLADPAQCQAWIDKAGEEQGHIDVLYNNASSPAFAKVPDMTIEEWKYGVDNEINLVFYASKYAWPWLAKKGGVIINVGSTAAHIAQPGGGFISHCAAKGACVSMTKAMAVDGKEDGIRSVCVSPGAVRTPELEKNFLNKVPNAENIMKGMLPAGRVGEVSDIAHLAVYLASDEATFLTGTEIIIDGGMTSI